MLGMIQKQPADQLDYDIDYSRWLPDGDTITTVTTTVEPGEEDHLEVVSASISGTTVKVWLAGGQDGWTYKVTVVIATTGGRIKEADFKVRVRDC